MALTFANAAAQDPVGAAPPDELLTGEELVEVDEITLVCETDEVELVLTCDVEELEEEEDVEVVEAEPAEIVSAQRFNSAVN